MTEIELIQAQALRDICHTLLDESRPIENRIARAEYIARMALRHESKIGCCDQCNAEDVEVLHVPTEYKWHCKTCVRCYDE